MTEHEEKPSEAPLRSHVHRHGRRIIRRVLHVIALGLAVVATIIILRAFDARKKPALASWHQESMEGEFQAGDLDDSSTLDDYLTVEAGLFDQVGDYQVPGDALDPTPSFIRYVKGGGNDPATFDHDWNRTTTFEPEEIRGGVLLLHGCSDSPYSVRSIAEIFQERGYYTLCLRLPGHGLIPRGLRDATWKDWIAASRIGARDVTSHIADDQPFYVCGYSVGGSLSVELAVDAVDRDDLRQPDHLFLFSPCIGVTAFARFALVVQGLSFIPYFEQSAWMGIAPELDPFKYTSFPVSAGYETWKLAAHCAAQARRVGLENLPPMIAFQSAVDVTVLASQLGVFFDALPPGNGSELVVFDINHAIGLQDFTRLDPTVLTDRIERDESLPYDLTVVTNRGPANSEVIARQRAAGADEVTEKALNLSWPDGVLSLTHVAIPFPPDDPLYGDGSATPEGRYALGAMQPRGERGLLTISTDELMRLRHNPFFDYMEERIVAALDAAEE